MRLSRRKPKGQLDLGFIRRAAKLFCLPCGQEYLDKNFPAHIVGRDHGRSLVRQNPTPRWRKPRVVRPFINDADYEDRMWADQEAREREDRQVRMAE